MSIQLKLGSSEPKILYNMDKPLKTKTHNKGQTGGNAAFQVAEIFGCGEE